MLLNNWSCDNLCMVGTIRTKEKCPVCKGMFQGEPLRCLSCKTTPTRYFIDLYWKKRCKLYSDQDGFPLSSWEQASRFLTHIRYEIDREIKSGGKYRFDPRNYISRDLAALRFENYIRAWFARRAEEIDLPDGISRSYLKSAESCARNHLLPAFGDLNIREINESQVEKFRLSLSKSLSIKTKKNIFGLLHKILKDAKKLGDIQRLPEFPTIKYDYPPIKWIDEEDQARILAQETNPVYRALFLFLMKQGCRPNEARALRWEKINFDRNLVTIDAVIDEGVYRGHTKTRDIRTLPIHPDVRAVLEKLPTLAQAGYVFTLPPTYSRPGRWPGDAVICRCPSSSVGQPLSENTVNAAWRRNTKKAGIEISLYQGTKHSGGSQAINAGVDLQVIQKMFGHKDPRTTLRYLSVATDRLKAYWDRPQGVPKEKNKTGKLLNFKKK